MTAADLLDALRSPAGLTALEVTWVVGVAIWMTAERRSPVATLAWILALSSIPLLGVPVYLWLGPRRLARKKLRMAGVRRAVGPALDAGALATTWDPQRASQLMRLAWRLGGLPPERARALTLLCDGDACYDALVEAIGRARDHVHAEYYIFEPGLAGARLRDALAAAARRGVEVKLLLDAAGSAATSARFLRPLRQAGGQVARFNPVLHRRLGQHLANFRTHRKILVADGLTGFTGGMNVSDDHSRAARGEAAWRDTHLRIEGAAVHGLQAAFLEDWYYATRPSGPPAGIAERRPRWFPADPEGDQVVQVVASGPDQEVPAVEAFLLAALALARERIWITTPYYVPDEPLAAALRGAALRGVDVQLVLPARTDSRVVDAASRTYHDELLAAGARIHLYGPPMVHAKTCVVDRDLALVGSANLDRRSLRLNFEVVAAVHGGPAVEALAALFEQDRARSRPKGWLEAREPFARRLLASAARLLAPQL
jgi:cardiolipin synthase A/B